jgi:hypothetical protein
MHHSEFGKGSVTRDESGVTRYKADRFGGQQSQRELAKRQREGRDTENVKSR